MRGLSSHRAYTTDANMEALLRSRADLPPDMPNVMAAADRFGGEILGPPPSAGVELALQPCPP